MTLSFTTTCRRIRTLPFILGHCGNKNRTVEVFRVAAYLTRRYL